MKTSTIWLLGSIIVLIMAGTVIFTAFQSRESALVKANTFQCKPPIVRWPANSGQPFSGASATYADHFGARNAAYDNWLNAGAALCGNPPENPCEPSDKCEPSGPKFEPTTVSDPQNSDQPSGMKCDEVPPPSGSSSDADGRKLQWWRCTMTGTGECVASCQKKSG